MRVAPTTTELLDAARRVRPGSGRAALRAAPARLRRRRLGDRSARSTSSSASVVFLVGLPLWLLDRARDQARLARAGLLPRPARRSRRARVRDAQVPDDARGAAEHQASLEAPNEASGPLFKIRDDPRVTRVGRAPARVLARRAAAGLERRCAARCRLVGPRPLPLRDYAPARGLAPQALPRAPGHDRPLADLRPLDLTFDDLVRLDFYYLENWSIWLDITILVKTMPAVFGRRRRVLSITPDRARLRAGCRSVYEQARPDYPEGGASTASSTWLELEPASACTSSTSRPARAKFGAADSSRAAVARDGASSRSPRCEQIFERVVDAERRSRGTAESIPLDDGDRRRRDGLAQAFHWFDPDRALPELNRVLRPRGGVALDLERAATSRDRAAPGVRGDRSARTSGDAYPTGR